MNGLKVKLSDDYSVCPLKCIFGEGGYLRFVKHTPGKADIWLNMSGKSWEIVKENFEPMTRALESPTNELWEISRYLTIKAKDTKAGKRLMITWNDKSERPSTTFFLTKHDFVALRRSTSDIDKELLRIVGNKPAVEPLIMDIDAENDGDDSPNKPEERGKKMIIQYRYVIHLSSEEAIRGNMWYASWSLAMSKGMERAEALEENKENFETDGFDVQVECRCIRLPSAYVLMMWTYEILVRNQIGDQAKKGCPGCAINAPGQSSHQHLDEWETLVSIHFDDSHKQVTCERLAHAFDKIMEAFETPPAMSIFLAESALSYPLRQEVLRRVGDETPTVDWAFYSMMSELLREM